MLKNNKFRSLKLKTLFPRASTASSNQLQHLVRSRQDNYCSSSLQLTGPKLNSTQTIMKQQYVSLDFKRQTEDVCDRDNWGKAKSQRLFCYERKCDFFVKVKY